MGVFEAAREQMYNYSRQVDLILSKTGLTETVKGLFTDHTELIDPNTGQASNARGAHASIHADELISFGFTAEIKNHFIEKDGKKYKITQTQPNNTTGLIVCILSDII